MREGAAPAHEHAPRRPREEARERAEAARPRRAAQQGLEASSASPTRACRFHHARRARARFGGQHLQSISGSSSARPSPLGNANPQRQAERRWRDGSAPGAKRRDAPHFGRDPRPAGRHGPHLRPPPDPRRHPLRKPTPAAPRVRGSSPVAAAGAQARGDRPARAACFGRSAGKHRRATTTAPCQRASQGRFGLRPRISAAISSWRAATTSRR
jgi:hypothetical protein